ncbi:MAG: hypothetical protein IPO22_13840 [Anaerolineales bacterium]|nr:hypothetical protein [Anaerolineales bacterium]
MAALLVPLGFALPQIGFFNSYNHVNAEKDIQRLQQVVSEAVNNGGESCLLPNVSFSPSMN